MKHFNYIKLTQMQKANCDIDCVFDGLDAKGGIYISDFESACLKQMREGLNIKAVISIATQGYLQYHDQLLDYLYIPAQDTDVYQISTHFQQTFVFLDQHRKNGNVLVHCMVGKSRSATIVAAYLLKKYKYSLETVMNLLQRRRKKINPNPGFMKQLQNYCDLIGVEKGNSKRRKSLSNYKDNKRLLVAKHSVDKSSTKHSQITSDTETQEQQEQQDKKNIQVKIEKIKQKYKGRQMRENNKFKKLCLDFNVKNTNQMYQFSTNNVSNNGKQTKSVQLP